MTDVQGSDPALSSLHVAGGAPDDDIITESSGSDAGGDFPAMSSEDESSVDSDESSEIGTPEIEQGKTIMTFAYDQGVVVAVDRSLSSSKRFFVENVIDLNTRVLAIYNENTDSESFLRDLQSQYRQHELEKGRRNTVEEASKWVAEFLHSRREEAVTVGTILILGWNEESAKSKMFVVSGVNEPHRRLIHDRGSGLPYTSYPENFQYRRNMSCTEAVEFIRDRIRIAAHHVAYDIKRGKGGEYGGFLSVYHVGAYGIKVVIDSEDLGEPREEELDTSEDEWEFEIEFGDDGAKVMFRYEDVGDPWKEDWDVIGGRMDIIRDSCRSLGGKGGVS